MCAACGELPPEPLEPYDAAGMPTWRCVYPSSCLNRARKRGIGMWAQRCTCPDIDISTFGEKPGSRTAKGLDPACPMHQPTETRST